MGRKKGCGKEQAGEGTKEERARGNEEGEEMEGKLGEEKKKRIEVFAAAAATQFLSQQFFMSLWLVQNLYLSFRLIFSRGGFFASFHILPVPQGAMQQHKQEPPH